MEVDAGFLVEGAAPASICPVEGSAEASPGLRAAAFRACGLASCGHAAPRRADQATAEPRRAAGVDPAPTPDSFPAGCPVPGTGKRSSARLRGAAAVELALGAGLRLIYRSDAHRVLGFVRLGDYVAEQLGVSLRSVQEWMRTEEALGRLPQTSEAFRAGEITAGHVRLLTRVATAESEAFWLSRARWMDVRRLSRAVAAATRREAGGEVPEGQREAAARRAAAEGRGERQHGGTVSVDVATSWSSGNDASAPDAGGIANEATPPAGGTRSVVGGSAGPNQRPDLESAEVQASAGASGDPGEERELVPLEIRAPAWLSKWWRETKVLVGQLVGRALPPGECLEVVLAEGASGTSASLDGAGRADVAEGQIAPESAPSCEARSGPDALGSEEEDDGNRGAERTGIEGSEGAAAATSDTGAGPAERPAGRIGRASLAEAEARDTAIRELIGSRQRQEAEMADHLACVRAGGAHLIEGFRSLEQYARERLGLSPRQMYYLMSLQKTLDRLPDLARAFKAGRLTLRQTLLCGRVASKETAAAWARRAEVVTLRRLEDEVEFWGLLRDERPGVWTLLQGGPLPEGIVLVPGKKPRLHESAPGEPAECAVAGRHGPGGSDLHTSAQVDRVCGAMSGCATDEGMELHACARGADPSGGSTRGGQPTDDDLRATAPVPPIDARALLAALEADERALPLPERRCTIRMRTDRETRRAWVDAVEAYRSQSAEFLEEWEVLALLIREFWKTWDNSQTRRQRRENPALEREGWRCAVPGCRSVGTGRLNTHHVVFKSQGGALTDPGNLTGICRGHHVALHDYNWVRCTGTAPDGLVWELGVAPGEEPFLVFRDDRRVGGTAA